MREDEEDAQLDTHTPLVHDDNTQVWLHSSSQLSELRSWGTGSDPRLLQCHESLHYLLSSLCFYKSKTLHKRWRTHTFVPTHVFVYNQGPRSLPGLAWAEKKSICFYLPDLCQSHTYTSGWRLIQITRISPIVYSFGVSFPSTLEWQLQNVATSRKCVFCLHYTMYKSSINVGPFHLLACLCLYMLFAGKRLLLWSVMLLLAVFAHLTFDGCRWRCFS